MKKPISIIMVLALCAVGCAWVERQGRQVREITTQFNAAPPGAKFVMLEKAYAAYYQIMMVAKPAMMEPQERKAYDIKRMVMSKCFDALQLYYEYSEHGIEPTQFSANNPHNFLNSYQVQTYLFNELLLYMEAK